MTRTTESETTEIGRLGERIVNLLCVLDMKHTFVTADFDEILEAVKNLHEKADSLEKLIDTPQTKNFLEALPLEAGHQLKR